MYVILNVLIFLFDESTKVFRIHSRCNADMKHDAQATQIRDPKHGSALAIKMAMESRQRHDTQMPSCRRMGYIAQGCL